jgi:hypothetical protein
LEWRSQARTGKLVSPRIITAGKVLDGDPAVSPDFSISLKTADDARRAVRDLKSRGVDILKVYDKLPREIYLAIGDEAKKAKLPFVGHVPSAVTSIEASDAGQRSIEHLGKVLEDSSRDPKRLAQVRSEPIKDGDYFAFTTRMGRSYDVILETLDTRRQNLIFRRFVQNGTWQVPTLSVKFGRTFIDELDAKGDPRTKYVEASQVDYWKPQNGFFSRYRTRDYIEAQKRYFAREQKLVGEMQKAGVKLLAGTDAPNAYVIAGFSLHDELARLVESGLSPMQALASATRNPAEYLGELSVRGTVEQGKIADIVLLDGDPLRAISNTTKIFAVVQGGKYLARSDLDSVLLDVEAVARNNK